MNVNTRKATTPVTALLVCSLFGVAVATSGGCGGTNESSTEPSTAATSEAISTAHAQGCQDHDDGDETPEARELASHRVSWDHPKKPPRERILDLKIIGMNDFHGQLSAEKLVAGRPAGGAAVLASYIKDAVKGYDDRWVLAHAGDQVGASPANSALLQDEPSITFLNMLANDDCSYHHRLDPHCNLVGTLGNHEFDEGKDEMLRLIHGGNYASGPFLESPWRGAKFPYVSANVVDAQTGRPILPPFVVKTFRGVKVGFIGAVLKATPTIVTPSGVAGVKFLDEADAVRSYIPALRALGVHAIVLQIHQGGFEKSYTGSTDAGAAPVTGDILDIVKRLPDDIDVVISGHTHAFTNAIVPNANGRPILVVQAFSASTAYDDIEIGIDRATGHVVSKSASIVTTFGDQGPGLTPDPAVAELVAKATDRVAPLVNQIVGTASAAITASQNAAGESALGDLIADSQRASVGADFAVMNPGGIRADIAAGQVTWGNLFTVQPFGNSVVKLTLTGQQVYDLLEQQWLGQTSPKMLQISGFEYTWNSTLPVGSRVVEVRKGGVAIDKAASYTMAANSFLSTGGDNFTALNGGTNRVGGPVDLDALIAYVEALPQPFTATISGRAIVLP